MLDRVPLVLVLFDEVGQNVEVILLIPARRSRASSRSIIAMARSSSTSEMIGRRGSSRISIKCRLLIRPSGRIQGMHGRFRFD